MIEGGFFYARRTTIFLDYGSRNRGRKPRKPAIIRPMTIPSELLRQCWFLAGPTASGKTATSIELAKRLNGEVLSLDSMAIYRRMDIGTAKPTVEERAGIPHHLIDIVDPHEEFSTADFLNHAEQAIRDILSRNKNADLRGGNGPVSAFAVTRRLRRSGRRLGLPSRVGSRGKSDARFVMGQAGAARSRHCYPIAPQ